VNAQHRATVLKPANVMSVLHVVFMSAHGNRLRSWEFIAVASCMMMPCPEAAHLLEVLKGSILSFIQRLPTKNNNTPVTPWIVLILCEYIVVRSRINN